VRPTLDDAAAVENRELGGEPVGNLDGLEPDGQGGYLATDWFSGALYRLDADGKATDETKPKMLGLVEHLSAALREPAEAAAV